MAAKGRLTRPRAREERGVALSLATLGKVGDYGALAHYADPAYYDKTYGKRAEDVRFYVELAQTLGGPVLEYGAGTGRITLPLARAGFEVAAVDLSRPMLAALEQKLRLESPAVRRRVRVIHADMCTKRFRSRFELVLAPFNTFLHLYTHAEALAFLGHVARHLAPSGLFAFDYSVPRPADLDRDPNRAYGAPPFRHPVTGAKIRYRERFEYDPLRQLLVVWMEFLPEDGDPWVIPLGHRQYFPCEMRALLERAGFEVVNETGDFAGSRPGPQVDSLVLECRRRQSNLR